MLFKATGSDAHLDEMKRRGLAGSPARERGRALCEPRTRVHPARTPARQRRDRGRGVRPIFRRSSTRPHIRGDLHMHTTYSDGRDDLASMVEGCHALGYEYMAITDHSSGSAASRTLARDDIARQRDEIDGAARALSRDDDPPRHRGRHPAGWPARFRGRHPRAVRHRPGVAPRTRAAGWRAADRRSLAAIRHPLVNVLCHPANQLVGHFDGLRAGLRRALRRGSGDRHGARNRRRAEPHGSRRRAARGRRRPPA